MKTEIARTANGEEVETTTDHHADLAGAIGNTVSLLETYDNDEEVRARLIGQLDYLLKLERDVLGPMGVFSITLQSTRH